MLPRYSYNEPERLREEFDNSLPQAEADALAKQLRAEGFKQTSNKFRSVARLPAGMTGLQALEEVDPRRAQEMRQDLEDQAAETYRRIHARGDGLTRTLDLRTFQAFKRLGER